MQDFFYFVGAYLSSLLLYFIFYFVLYRWKTTHFLKKVFFWLKKPIFVFLFLIIAYFFDLSTFWPPHAARILSLLFVFTFGWSLWLLLRGIYKEWVQAMVTLGVKDSAIRASLTQGYLFYRLLLFFIAFTTLASMLLTIPSVRSWGVALIGSAGILGLALGVAAKPILLNLMAGLQITFSRVITLEDAVMIQGEFGFIEAIELTHVVMRTGDLRRIIFPISYFIEHSFENWSKKSTELLAAVFLYVDYTVPMQAIRERFVEILKETSFFDGNMQKVHVTDSKENCIELRFLMSAQDPTSAFELKAFVREKMLDYLVQNFPDSLPKQRW